MIEGRAWHAPGRTRRRVSVYARSDLQAIGGVPGCDELHSRPIDPRTGLPVPIWELTCPAHEAWICGEGKPKVMLWERDANGGFQQRWVSPMEPTWSRTIEDLPLTPVQLQQPDPPCRAGRAGRRHPEHPPGPGVPPGSPGAAEARALAGRGAVKMATCHACHSDYLVGAQYCPQCAVRGARKHARAG